MLSLPQQRDAYARGPSHSGNRFGRAALTDRDRDRRLLNVSGPDSACGATSGCRLGAIAGGRLNFRWPMQNCQFWRLAW